jgi:hypothetical protein
MSRRPVGGRSPYFFAGSCNQPFTGERIALLLTTEPRIIGMDCPVRVGLRIRIALALNAHQREVRHAAISGLMREPNPECWNAVVAALQANQDHTQQHR